MLDTRVQVDQRQGFAQFLHMSIAILRNQLKRSGLTSRVKSALNIKDRGGRAWETSTLNYLRAKILGQYRTISSRLPEELSETSGVEIGPGESTALATCISMHGAHMDAVEKYCSVDDTRTQELMKHLRLSVVQSQVPNVIVQRILFEDYWPPHDIDFVYSVDVMEHVRSPQQVFCHCFAILKPGGKMIHSIDLAGHQIGDTEHLCCPDWLWSLAFSHMETTNRFRLSDFEHAVETAGFQNVTVKVTRSFDPTSIRNRVIPCWRDLSDRDLGALQIVISAIKPATSTTGHKTAA